jgi:predicted nuclease of restriction endonuclease-like (RecB) superfamily
MDRCLTTRPEGYEDFLQNLKRRIRAAQVKAVFAVNRELIFPYWHIGREILERQRLAGLGAKVIERLAADLHREFPGMTGFSRTNLLYMRAFAEAWPKKSFVQQVVGQIPWSSLLVPSPTTAGCDLVEDAGVVFLLYACGFSLEKLTRCPGWGF